MSMTRLHRFLVVAATLAVLLGVFALYTRPAFLMNLADQLWTCF
jgi:hypothetical protein